VLEQIQKEYGNKVRHIYKDFPLGGQIYSEPAAIAARCAAKSGKFWEYHNELYNNQSSLGPALFEQIASRLGLPMNDWKKCTEDIKIKEAVRNDLNEGIKLGVTGTPTFFINGKKVVGALPLENFKLVIDEELKKTNKK
jgi:protein-disulfide isomerase